MFNRLIRKVLYVILLLGMLFSTSGASNPFSFSLAEAGRGGGATDPMAQVQPVDELSDFGLISDTDGWILVGRHLYLTTSHGASWSEISPALPPAATIYAVRFLDAEMGWVLWSDSQAEGDLVLQVERTSDQGRNWNNSIIQTLMPNDPAANVGNASIDWLDEKIGWVSVKQITGSNFSSGILFRTEDGGQTWQRLTLPIGEPVHFVNNQVGWMAGGPARDQLFKTQDGGNTWEKQLVPGGIVSGQSYSLYPPVFDSPENGLLPVVTQKGNNFQLGFFSTSDGGQSWLPVSKLPLDSQVGWLSLSLLNAQNLAAAVPNSDQIIQMVNGEVKMVNNQDGMSASIIDLKMLTYHFGWAKWNTGDCTTQAAADGSATISCSSTTKLIETQDGGITWDVLGLPGNVSGTLTQSYQSASTSATQVAAGQGKTLLVVGQGFDICEIPTLSKLQTWWNYGPYKSVNLYIGGVARACPNTALTAAYVNDMRAQGWTFIPTWVGLQAPCYPYGNDNIKFSLDVNQAYVQGRDEAYFASARLAELGLTNEDMTGSVVYYDMEIYGDDPACRNAVNAFVNGWVSHLHDHTWVTHPQELGNLAGVYGATGVYYSQTGCSAGLGDYLTIANVPDAIWPARWYLPAGVGTYDPTASVWDIGSCIPTTVWANHQRIRQYAGDHYETWGGLRMGTIDSDVLDGVVAVPYFGTPSANFTASTLSNSPLAVKFTIVNTAFMSSCTWDYGDGQTGSSCAYIHTHTYSSAGTYTVSLTVSSPWGSENLTSSNSIIVNPYWIYLPQAIR
jgi:photosystem II stability/assembly factor-like uncharacterized protein